MTRPLPIGAVLRVVPVGPKEPGDDTTMPIDDIALHIGSLFGYDHLIRRQVFAALEGDGVETLEVGAIVRLAGDAHGHAPGGLRAGSTAVVVGFPRTGLRPGRLHRPRRAGERRLHRLRDQAFERRRGGEAGAARPGVTRSWRQPRRAIGDGP